MAEQIRFKERVRQTVIQCASDYKSYFVDYEYLICSDAFTLKKYYIVDAHEDNYLHLTGVSVTMSQNDFFKNCIDGSLQETDFSFIKAGQTEAAVKGTVRRKINALPGITNVFSANAQVEEDFHKNRIYCSFAVGNSTCTLGFSVSNKTKPMTLLNGNELDLTKAKPIKLVLRKPSGADKFDEIVVGDSEILSEYLSDIKDMVDESLLRVLSVSTQI